MVPLYTLVAGLEAQVQGWCSEDWDIKILGSHYERIVNNSLGQNLTSQQALA